MSNNELEEYAREQINASGFPNDKHICSFFKCQQCDEIVNFALDISYSRACDKARPAMDFAGTAQDGQQLQEI